MLLVGKSVPGRHPKNGVAFASSQPARLRLILERSIRMKRILVVAMLVAASSFVFGQPVSSSVIRFGNTLVDGGFTRADGGRDLISDVMPGGVTQGAAACVTTSTQAPPAKAAKTTVNPSQESRLGNSSRATT